MRGESGRRPELRRSPRYRCGLVVDLAEGRTRRRLVTLDVSRHGMFLSTDSPPRERFLVRFTVYLPDGPLAGTAFVSRTVRISGGLAGAGLQFFALSQQAKNRWDRFVHRLAGGASDAIEPRFVGHPDRATFIVKLKDAARLLELHDQSFKSGGLYMTTPVLQETGAEVGLVIVHPDSEQEFLLLGGVERVCQEHPKGMEVKLRPMSPAERGRFRRFISTGQAEEGNPRDRRASEPAAYTAGAIGGAGLLPTRDVPRAGTEGAPASTSENSTAFPADTGSLASEASSEPPAAPGSHPGAFAEATPIPGPTPIPSPTPAASATPGVDASTPESRVTAATFGAMPESRAGTPDSEATERSVSAGPARPVAAQGSGGSAKNLERGLENLTGRSVAAGPPPSAAEDSADISIDIVEDPEAIQQSEQFEWDDVSPRNFVIDFALAEYDRDPRSTHELERRVPIEVDALGKLGSVDDASAAVRSPGQGTRLLGRPERDGPRFRPRMRSSACCAACGADLGSVVTGSPSPPLGIFATFRAYYCGRERRLVQVSRLKSRGLRKRLLLRSASEGADGPVVALGFVAEVLALLGTPRCPTCGDDVRRNALTAAVERRSRTGPVRRVCCPICGEPAVSLDHRAAEDTKST